MNKALVPNVKAACLDEPKGVVRAIRRSLLRDRSGAITIEFALVAPVFLGLLLGILETGLLYLKTTALDAGVEEAKRVVLTGQVQAAGDANQQLTLFKTAFCNQAGWLIPCASVQFDVRAFTSFSAAAMPNPVSGGVFDSSGLQFSPGTANQIVVIRAYYETASITGMIRNDVANMANGSVMLVSSAAFKNEP